MIKISLCNFYLTKSSSSSSDHLGPLRVCDASVRLLRGKVWWKMNRASLCAPSRPSSLTGLSLNSTAQSDAPVESPKRWFSESFMTSAEQVRNDHTHTCRNCSTQHEPQDVRHQMLFTMYFFFLVRPIQCQSFKKPWSFLLKPDFSL